LRVAKAIMDDWQNDTCVGKYLKTINERRVNKNKKEYKKTQIDNYTKSYGGQFHLNLVGGKDRNILGMDGYGGQQIVIDLDNSKIIVINSVHYGYDWNKIVHKKIK
jgi:ribosomal protein S4E